jgi:riboflavin synthase
MFTGIVQEIGEVVSVRRTRGVLNLRIKAPKSVEGMEEGESVCIDGVCLTVTNRYGEWFEVDVVPETERRSTLSSLSVGSLVNIERAARVGDRIGGHIVLGHVDGKGSITGKRPFGGQWIYTISYPEELGKYIVEKGSIAIDGISLTVAGLEGGSISIAVIPFTMERTTLGMKGVGDQVNIEVDIIGKYVESLIKGYVGRERLDFEFLKRTGIL